jgi:hypothetical protein
VRNNSDLEACTRATRSCSALAGLTQRSGARAVNKLLGEEIEAVQSRGGDRRSDQIDISNRSGQGGTSVNYTIARLKAANFPLLAEQVINGEISAAEARRQAGHDVLILVVAVVESEQGHIVVAVGLRHAILTMLTSTTTWVVNAMRAANKSPVRPCNKTPPIHAAVGTGLEGH